MKEVLLNNGCLPILNWAKNPEEGAINQAKNVASHPCVVQDVVLCPDCHAGYGVPIGTVLATRDDIIVNAIGVDIGCSMSSGRTNIKADDVTKEDLKRILGGSKEYPGGIISRIPTGMKHHNKDVESPLFNDERWSDPENYPICNAEFNSAKRQLGTLGGGNHFIELQKGDDGYLWYMVHSGSRNLGYKVCQHYNKIAENYCTMFRQYKVVKDQLAFLPRGLKEYNQYINEMKLCMDFAKESHVIMGYIIEEELAKVFSNMEITERIYTRHNYADIENFNGFNYMIHRKGAILARENMKGIIPGSQGTASYIVVGKGNSDSFYSASHGSGRVMSRTRAQKELSLEVEQEKMKGIVHNMTTQSQLDEAPSAYKDIEEVISLEADLVTPLVKLTPLAVLKGWDYVRG